MSLRCWGIAFPVLLGITVLRAGERDEVRFQTQPYTPSRTAGHAVYRSEAYTEPAAPRPIGRPAAQRDTRGFFGRRPDCVVLGECTNLGINRGHRGRCEISVTTRGVSCHGSAPARGVNAVYAMTPIVEGIVALEREVAHDPFLGAGTIAVTKIESVSGSLNVVPDLCRIVIDRRMTTGETAAGAMDDIRRVAAGASGPGGTAAVTAAARAASVELLRYTERSWTGYQADVGKDYPTWLLDEDHPVVQAGVAAARLVLGREPAISRWDFSTDGVATMGRHKIPTIGFGPSEERFAHTVQDQVSVDHLMAATAFYALFPDTVARMHG